MSKIKGVSITPSQWTVLQITHNAKSIHIKDIAKEMNTTGSASTQLINELENKQYLKRAPDPNDGRATLITLTNKSKKMIDDMELVMHESCAELFRKLSDTELKTFSKIYSKISK
jgi:DNA-binding MarR family transcriptional regulator